MTVERREDQEGRAPLNLTVYLRDEDGDYQHPVTQLWWSELEVDDNMELKRFTDAELAAEVWHAKERCMFVSAFTGFGISTDSKTAKQAETLHRFATLPHYDEAVS